MTVVGAAEVSIDVLISGSDKADVIGGGFERTVLIDVAIEDAVEVEAFDDEAVEDVVEVELGVLLLFNFAFAGPIGLRLGAMFSLRLRLENQ